MSFKLKLLSLLANHQSESDGDELFIKIGEKKIWPLTQTYQRINGTEEKLMLDFEIPKGRDSVEVELWEYDNFIFSSRLGKFLLTVDEKGGPFHTDLSRESKEYANYSLVWEAC